MSDDDLGHRFRARVMPLKAPAVPLQVIERRSRRSFTRPVAGGLILVIVAAAAVGLGGLRRDQVEVQPPSAGAAGSTAVVVRDLPHVKEAQPGTVRVCNDMALSGTLHGAQSDPRSAWVVSTSESRVEISWPAGYSARFVPMLEVIGPGGAVVAREGDAITLGGSFDAVGSVFEACSAPR
jgi:hypothetical protein